MTFVANAALVLALLLWAAPLQLLLHQAPRANDGGALWGAVFVALPLWSLLWVALAVATSRGALDWAARGRALQHAVLALACLALAAVTVLSVVARHEHASQLPWATRPLGAWGAAVLPAAALVFAAASLHPGLAARLPALVIRVPFGLAVATGLLAGLGLLVEAAAGASARGAARVEEAAAFDAQRDREIVARLATLDPERDFPELLGFANRFEKPEIRAVAVEKARRHPRFAAALADALRGGWAEKGLVWIDAEPLEEPAALAAPAREAILVLAASARDLVRDSHHLRGDELDWDTRLAISAAEKLAGHGVDLRPALVALRAAMDEPRERQPVHLRAAATLDRWLAEHPR